MTPQAAWLRHVDASPTCGAGPMAFRVASGRCRCGWSSPLEPSHTRLVRVRVVLEFDEEVDEDWSAESAIAKVERRFGLARGLVPGAPRMGPIQRAYAKIVTDPGQPLSRTDEEVFRALLAPDWNTHVARSPECGARAVDDLTVDLILRGEMSCPCGWHARQKRPTPVGSWESPEGFDEE